LPRPEDTVSTLDYSIRERVPEKKKNLVQFYHVAQICEARKKKGLEGILPTTGAHHNWRETLLCKKTGPGGVEPEPEVCAEGKTDHSAGSRLARVAKGTTPRPVGEDQWVNHGLCG
jgi:hypothetical protein